jgi:hypothetical protein
MLAAALNESFFPKKILALSAAWRFVPLRVQ